MDNDTRRPVAERVAVNVRDLRKARGLSLAELSARMDVLGRPLSLSGLSKVERGDRGVDVDDLVALAIALDVTPNRLLLTPTASKEERIKLTPTARTATKTAWFWACGEDYFDYDPATAERALDLDRLRRFERENRPHDPPDDTPVSAVAEHIDDVREIVRRVLELQMKGLPRRAVLDGVEMITGLTQGHSDGER